MKISIIWRQNLLCPVVICDICGERIEPPMENCDLATAEKYWGGIMQDVGSDIIISHKGKCGEIAEWGLKRDRPGELIMWSDLDRVLVQLLYNVTGDIQKSIKKDNAFSGR